MKPKPYTPPKKYTPEPPPGLIDDGKRWVEGKYAFNMCKEITRQLEFCYSDAVAIYGAHRDKLRRRVDDAGGVKKVTQADFFDETQPEISSIILKNNERITLSEALNPGPLIINLGRQSIASSGGPEYEQTHEVALRFGGSIIRGNKAELSNLELISNSMINADTAFDKLLNDDSYFPEDTGITDRVTTTFEGDEHTAEQYYSVHGELWRMNPIFDPIESPDRQGDPMGYRRWALQDLSGINLSFMAPRETTNDKGESYTETAQLIDINGLIKDDVLAAINALGRFSTLLNSYASEMFPGAIFYDTDRPQYTNTSNTVEQTAGGAPEIVLEN